MLDNLLEIEIAYNMLKVDGDSAKDPIDMHYQKLKTNLQVCWLIALSCVCRHAAIL